MAHVSKNPKRAEYNLERNTDGGTFDTPPWEGEVGAPISVLELK